MIKEELLEDGTVGSQEHLVSREAFLPTKQFYIHQGASGPEIMKRVQEDAAEGLEWLL
jgi:hypothetical protein